MARLVWFKSDLRIRDNPAFFHAVQDALKSNSRVLAAYIISPTDWKNHDIAACKVDFILRNLSLLSKSLWDRFRIPLLIRTAHVSASAPAPSHGKTHKGAIASVVQWMEDLCRTYQIQTVYFNREYEINEQRRDQAVSESLAKLNINVCAYDDQCVVLPGELRSKSQNQVYTVFSPFKKSWYQKVYLQSKTLLRLYDLGLDVQLEGQHGGPEPDKVPLEVKGFTIDDETLKKKLLELWPAGEEQAHQRLHVFASGRAIEVYDEQRNMTFNEAGTSGLSSYLASGVLSSKQCVVKALENNHQRLDGGKAGVVSWISELVWRDFYRHILVAYPRICMGAPFKLATLTVPWRYDEIEFQAWCTGRTGFPIVDAAMRQMLATGWMHNRSRMIVGSFLTKHLLHHWQLGERFFSQHLIDGDLASNNGGWQWVASTGTDAQPYFRVFNPYSQSDRFDPEGVYIRRWVPELRSVKSNKAIHNPAAVLGKSAVEKLGYCCPIVEHELGRRRAIEAFKNNAGSSETTSVASKRKSPS